MKSVISFRDFPELPTPLLSDIPGESYEWGDYYLVLQHDPPFVLDYAKSVAENRKIERTDLHLQYFYVLSLFYKKGKNPEGMDSCRPCEVLTIEQVRNNQTGCWSEPVLGHFSPEGHSCISVFNREITQENARKAFFEVLSSKIPGTPVKIGTIQDFMELRKEKNSPGCLALSFLLSASFWVSVFAFRFGMKLKTVLAERLRNFAADWDCCFFFLRFFCCRNC